MLREPGYSVGTIIAGRFRLDSVIAQGGLATLYRATRLGDPEPRLCALKAADCEELSATHRRHMLEAEMRALARLRHRHIVTLLSADPGAVVPYLVVPFVPGENLAERLRRRAPARLTFAETWRLLHHLCSALSAVHREGLVHSDVKPSNIMLSPPDDDACLIDFSSVRRRGAVWQDEPDGVSLPVSPLYASPQHLQGHPADPADDVFGFAVLAHILFTGRHPFDRYDSVEASRRGLGPGPISDIPARLRDPLRTCLSFASTDRAAGFAAVAGILASTSAAPGAPADRGQSTVVGLLNNDPIVPR